MRDAGHGSAEKTPAAWAALAGLAAGLGFLTKGPLALVIPAIVLVPIWWRERHHARASIVARRTRRCSSSPLQGSRGTSRCLRVTARRTCRAFSSRDNLERFATTRYNDRASGLVLRPDRDRRLPALDDVPAGAAVAPAARDLRGGRRRLTDDEWRLLIWTVVPLLLFTVSVGKQPRYILPVLPPVAMMLGRGIANRINALRRPAASRELTHCHRDDGGPLRGDGVAAVPRPRPVHRPRILRSPGPASCSSRRQRLPSR